MRSTSSGNPVAELRGEAGVVGVQWTMTYGLTIPAPNPTGLRNGGLGRALTGLNW